MINHTYRHDRLLPIGQADMERQRLCDVMGSFSGIWESALGWAVNGAWIKRSILEICDEVSVFAGVGCIGEKTGLRLRL